MALITSERRERLPGALGGVLRLVRNAASVLASDITNRVATFVLYALVARYLGAAEFGRLSLALTLFQTFQLLAIAGLQTLVTREVARDRERTGEYVGNGGAVIAVFALGSAALMLLFARLLQYPPDTTAIFLLMALGLLPYALSVIMDAVFQAWERMHYIIIANALVNLLKVGLIFAALAGGAGLRAIVLLLLLCHTALLLVKLGIYLRRIQARPARVSLAACRAIVAAGLTFLGMDGLTAILSSIGIILLSKFGGPVEVGLFNAANQIMVPIALVFQSVMIGVFPTMCRRFDEGRGSLKRVTELLIAGLTAVVLPTLVALYALAGPLLLLLYGQPEFLAAVPIVRILLITVLLRVFTQVFGHVLVASMRERVNLRILLVDVVLSAICYPILIARYGLMGAALASVLVSLADCVQHYLPVVGLFAGRISLARLLWRPALAGGGMALFMLLAGGAGLALAVLGGSAVYLLALAGMTLSLVGGPRGLTRHVRQLLIG